MREYLKNTVKQALLGYRRGHNTHPIKRVFSAFLGITILTTTFITALIPLTEIPIYAAGTGKILQLGTGPLENGSTVYYGSKTDAIGWNIIGFKGDGVASGSENATLISSGTLGTTNFSNSEGKYRDSLLHTEINNILSNRFTDNEDTVMPDRTLPGKEDRVEAYAQADSNYIWGTDLSGQKLWPLSTVEAKTLYHLLPDIAGIESKWWLRSPGNEYYKAAYVPTDGYVFCTGFDVDNAYGVRPAFNINLSSIILTSAAEGGKNPGTEGAGTLNEVAAYTGTAWKLTISDSARSSFTASAGTGATVSMPEGYTSWTVPVTYSNAQAGENEHVSAILTDSSGVALYYGYIATNSTGDTKNVTIPTGLAKGTYTLNVFNEQCNGDKKTDLSSPIRTIGLTVTEAQQVETCTITFEPNGGKGEMDDQTVDKGVKTKLNKNTFTRSGYSFDGWNTDPDGDGKSYGDKDDITVEKDTTLYAQWKKDKDKDDDDDDDSHEESYPSSSSQPSWTPQRASETIAKENAANQQQAAAQMTSATTKLTALASLTPSQKASYAKTGLDLDMTKVSIIDANTAKLLVANNKIPYNVKIMFGQSEITITIPAGFNFKPFIKADGTINIHEVLWSIISGKTNKR